MQLEPGLPGGMDVVSFGITHLLAPLTGTVMRDEEMIRYRDEVADAVSARICVDGRERAVAPGGYQTFRLT